MSGTSRRDSPHQDLSEEVLKRIQEIVSENLKTSFRPDPDADGVRKRAQHGKHHGCVKATFTVADNIPAECRVGVFAKKRTFDALIRFSNGGKTDDRQKDAHGMAIKLLAVEGPHLLSDSDLADEESGRSCQDFILVDNPTFFSKSLEEYLVFNRHFTKFIVFNEPLRLGEGKSWFPRAAAAAEGLTYLLAFHTALMLRAKKFAGNRPSSPLTTPYWSTTPYQLGDRVVKYMAKPQPYPKTRDQAGVADSNGLAIALWTALGKQEIRFTFGMHPQPDPKTHPIENTTLDWHKDAKRFVELATIVIPKQDRPEDEGPNAASLADRIVYSPWHGLIDHRPLGGINLARREVYRVMAKVRQ